MERYNSFSASPHNGNGKGSKQRVLLTEFYRMDEREGNLLQGN
jgi:hypothetical protein